MFTSRAFGGFRWFGIGLGHGVEFFEFKPLGMHKLVGQSQVSTVSFGVVKERTDRWTIYLPLNLALR
jgi:hypothetical protein